VATPKADSARLDRSPDALRPITLERNAAPYAEGSCLVSFGRTRVLCTVSVEDGVPGWRRGRGEGWLTAEYAMLPRATSTRTARERGQVGGRTQEIQRLIGRSVRAMLDVEFLPAGRLARPLAALDSDDQLVCHDHHRLSTAGYGRPVSRTVDDR